MKVTEMRCVNFPSPTSAGVIKGIPTAGISLAAFFSTRKYISNVASSIFDCSFRFFALLFDVAPSSISRSNKFSSFAEVI